MKQVKNKQVTIAWAMDPFQEEVGNHAHALQVLAPIAKAFKAKIQPISFIDRGQFYVSDDMDYLALLNSKDRKSAISYLVNKRINAVFSKALRSQFQDPIVLVSSGDEPASLFEKISEMDKAAKKCGAIFVGLHSHARKGLQRFLMGSFAESFVLTSSSAALVMNPACKPPKQIKTIMFPSDFSKESLLAFKQALLFASRLKAKIIVVHYLYKPSPSLFTFGEKAKARAEKDYQLAQHRSRKWGARMLAMAKAAKVKSQFDLIEATGRNDAASAILKLATRSKCDLFALVSRSDDFRAALIGATGRTIARAAECPVLILHR